MMAYTMPESCRIAPSGFVSCDFIPCAQLCIRHAQYTVWLRCAGVWAQLLGRWIDLV
jgi:hypothetical protein